jgi:hypothetical protein
LLIRLCWLLRHVCCWFGSVSCCDISVVNSALFVFAACLLLIRFCSLFRHVYCWFGFVGCCGISHSRLNLGVVVRNPTPVGHSMGDRLVSKSWQRFRILELGLYIILIGSQFVATCLFFVCCNMSDMSVSCLLQYEWYVC